MAVDGFFNDITHTQPDPNEVKLPIKTITAPASGTPYTSARRELILVYGGTSLSCQFTRLGTTVSLPGIFIFLTMPGDQITCNYLLAPSMTIIPQ